MQKKVFRYKIVYWLSVIYFAAITLLHSNFLILTLLKEPELLKTLYLATSAVLSLFVCVNLFERNQKVISLINITIVVIILWTASQSVKIFETRYIYFPHDFKYIFLLIVYMIIANRSAYSSKSLKVNQ